MRSALVLGAGGLLGSEVLTTCRSAGLRTEETAGKFDWDDPDQISEQVAAIVEKLTLDEVDEGLAVFWCAGVAYVGSADAAKGKPSAALLATLDGLERVVAAGARVHFTYASSAGAVWSGADNMPASESTPTAATHGYGHFKLLEEEAVQTWAATHDVSVTVARISNLFGRNQDAQKNQGLLTKLVLSTITGAPTRLFVPLDTCRDYLPATSAAAMLLADALEALSETSRGVRPSVRIITSGRAYTIAQVCGILQRMRRRRVPVAHVVSDVTSQQPLRLIFATERPTLDVVIPSLEESLRTMFDDESRRLALSS